MAASRRKAASRLVASLAIAVVGTAAGCAAEAPRDVAATSPGTDARPREVNVVLRDYLFVPNTIELFPGETVRFNVINGGLVTHELVLGTRRVQQAWEDAEARATPPLPFSTSPPVSVAPELAGLRVVLASGDQTSVLYRVPTATELQAGCHIPGHAERGMVADVRLIPRPGSAQP